MGPRIMRNDQKKTLIVSKWHHAGVCSTGRRQRGYTLPVDIAIATRDSIAPSASFYKLSAKILPAEGDQLADQFLV
jgi:hypothetical protein